MKKLLLVLGMITCMFGLTACKEEEAVTENYGVTEEQAAEYGKGLIETMNEIVVNEQMEQYKAEEVIYSALGNYSSALEDMGDYQSVKSYTVEYDDGVIINLEISGSLRAAAVEMKGPLGPLLQIPWAYGGGGSISARDISGGEVSVRAIRETGSRPTTRETQNGLLWG